jgi:DNA gyrase subunit A
LAKARSRKSTPSLFDLADTPETPGAVPPPPSDGPEAVALHEAAQSRYLNYALSVITSRALPDVRDGLKPVQRRILYTMWQQNLTADAKHRKCAKVVGDVMGSYHPHGDAALYETLVRMAQPFSLRYPLVDGSGNFGSLDGDSAAAMRYTECRLARISDEMLSEIDQRTVHFRPNYDGTRTEPVVLPARIPSLLVNGATGIAVGMATNVPPHNLGEVCTALVKLLDNEELSTAQLCRYVKGPDFPTGGQILNSPDELKEIYKTGSGTIRLRAMWEEGPGTRGGRTVYVTSIPYSVNKAALVERIADVVLSRKLPLLLDVKDVSTDDVRIALEIKKDADPQLVMAYLFKNTPLQTNFIVNLTCLIPTENAEVGRPERLDLHQALMYFLQFRLQVVTNRLEHELESLRKRIHILEGFEKVFDALDEIIKIIRKSEGKADSAEKIMKRFGLDAEQADAILELKLYRLARLEILVIQNEVAEKRKRARQITSLLKDEDGRWRVVRDEIEEIHKTYGARDDKRRTLIESEEEVSFTADDFIVEEDNVVIVSRDGWVKRQKEVRDVSTTRLREGDSVLAVLQGSTRATVVLFTNFGVAYTSRIIDVPASTGYGEPVQKLFNFRDGERVVAAMLVSPNAQPPGTRVIGVTRRGDGFRFNLDSHRELSTRSGRRYAKVAEGDELVGVLPAGEKDILVMVTSDAHALLCAAAEAPELANPGRGVTMMKVDEDEVLLGFGLGGPKDNEVLIAETESGKKLPVGPGRYKITSRGGKGHHLAKRSKIAAVAPPPPAEEKLLN